MPPLPFPCDSPFEGSPGLFGFEPPPEVEPLPLDLPLLLSLLPLSPFPLPLLFPPLSVEVAGVPKVLVFGPFLKDSWMDVRFLSCCNSAK